MKSAMIGIVGVLALGVLAAASVSTPADAAKPKGKFVKSWSECYTLAAERGFTGSTIRVRVGRNHRDKFIRQCRRGIQA